VRDTVRAALMKARPVPQFVTEIRAHATAGQALTPGSQPWERSPEPSVHQFPQPASASAVDGSFALQPVLQPPISARLQFEAGIAVEANAALPVTRGLEDAPLVPNFAPAPQAD